MKDMLLLAAPVVIGAVIGYVTNAAAIKMLFRPLKAVRFLGVRVPFTPGVLPRERHKLALSIGSMVERKLLTPEILRERIRREDVRAAINSSVARYTGKWLEQPLCVLFAGENTPPPVLFRIFRDFLGSPAFNSLLESFLVSLADYAEDSRITVGELLGYERIGILQEKFKYFIRENLESQAPHVAQYAASALDAAFPGMTRQLLQFLMKDEIHQALETQGRIFLNNAILKLSTLQRFFISAGQYDKTLHERMPEIIDDLIAQIESLMYDPDARRRITGFAEESVRSILSQEASLETLSRMASSLPMLYAAMPLGEAVKKLAAGDIRTAVRRVRGFFEEKSGPGFGRFLSGAVNAMLDAHKDWTVSGFFMIDRSKKEKIDAYIGETLLKNMDEHLEEVLNGINIKALVSDRIDSLDMVDVEHIVLDVMDNQLKWINVFGAILGAFIGGAQIVLSWFASGGGG
ncbi:MAG: DUF445 family protein [Spirochaetaceae bacterium]|jgi:uncharacterized membrane protein YheB (UPF0754 family)|nr:DUF445 family protein [Spirochaetaceae bacterium]